jgi:acyl-CoA reductase-like NAD-dependent aldehyde dehydrogenase
MSTTYTPFTKTDRRFMQKRLNEVLERLEQKSYDINGELEALDLDEDGKNWRQDAIMDIEAFADELRPVAEGLDNVVKTYRNPPSLTVEQQLARNRRHRAELREAQEDAMLRKAREEKYRKH